MADIKKLPDHLKPHAESMPADLLKRLSDEELAYRLRHYHQLTEDAASIKNPAVSRHLTAHAGRVLKALPHYEYCEEKRRLERGRDNASRHGGLSDIWQGYMDSLKELDKKSPQVPGVGEYLRRIKEHPAEEPTADSKGAGAMLYKRARVDRLVKAELKKYEAKAAEEANRIRKEIQELKDRRTA